MAYRKMETFNSIKYLKLLKNSGMTEQQAEIQIEMVQEANRNGLEHLATKEQLNQVHHELKNDISNLRTELKEDMNNLRVELQDENTKFHYKIENNMNDLRNELKDANTKLQLEHQISFASLDKKINSSKWQVLAGIFSIFILMPYSSMISKYWGL